MYIHTYNSNIVCTYVHNIIICTYVWYTGVFVLDVLTYHVYVVYTLNIVYYMYSVLFVYDVHIDCLYQVHTCAYGTFVYFVYCMYCMYCVYVLCVLLSDLVFSEQDLSSGVCGGEKVLGSE